MKYKLLDLYESFGMPDEQEVKYTSEDRQAFAERVRRFNEYSKILKQSSAMKTVCEEIKSLVEMAGEFTLKETDQWFDNVTVNKHLKSLNDSYKIFEKTATEVYQLQQRLEASYQDIGRILETYYEIDDPQDETSDFVMMENKRKKKVKRSI